MKSITNMNSNHKHLVTLNDMDRANELNDFFLRFDSYPTLQAADDFNSCIFADCNDLNRVFIVPQQIQSIFSKISTKKSTGPDGLPAVLLKNALQSLQLPGCPYFNCKWTATLCQLCGKNLLSFLYLKYLVLQGIEFQTCCFNLWSNEML